MGTFVIDGPTRTGSTTLAKLLNCHPDINCVIEPFHNRRAGAQFNRLAVESGSIRPALSLIWQRWNGLKHVWESGSDWPFIGRPDLNDAVLSGADLLIFLRRRNLLRRYVSSVISKRMGFWVGTREEFIMRLDEVHLPELSAAVVERELQNDEAAVSRRLSVIENENLICKHLFYEDLFEEGISREEQVLTLKNLLSFLGFKSEIAPEILGQWGVLFDPNTFRWASSDTYSRIPGIFQIEKQFGSSERGWLFR